MINASGFGFYKFCKNKIEQKHGVKIYRKLLNQNFVFAKIGSVVPRDQQIKLISPYRDVKV